MDVNEYVSMCTYVYLSKGPQQSQKGSILPAAEVTGGCKLPPAGTGNWIWALCESSKSY